MAHKDLRDLGTAVPLTIALGRTGQPWEAGLLAAPDAEVTSLARLRGSAPSPDAAAEGVAKRMVVALQDVLDDGRGLR